MGWLRIAAAASACARRLLMASTHAGVPAPCAASAASPPPHDRGLRSPQVAKTTGEHGATNEDRLAGIQAITDTALAFLDVDDLLKELLDRVLEILGADTAAVLLLDEAGEELFARSARGLEEEVRQGVRVPLGRGFAGRIAAERIPVVLNQIDETTVWNPILWQKGIRAMLGVPLISGGALVGVLHVGTLWDRVFTGDDIELLQVAADRVAAAVRVRLLEAERDAAEALQRSLLPSTPPRLLGLEFDARYVPAERGGIGGDWYDVFVVDNGDVWLVAGDVAGHGMRAAVVMGRLRSALRAYALVAGTPDEVLSLTNRKVQHFEVGQMATVAVAVLSPPYDRARHRARRPPAADLGPTGAACGCTPAEARSPARGQRRGPAASHHGGPPRRARCCSSSPTGSSSDAGSPSTTGSNESVPRRRPLRRRSSAVTSWLRPSGTGNPRTTSPSWLFDALREHLLPRPPLDDAQVVGGDADRRTAWSVTRLRCGPSEIRVTRGNKRTSFNEHTQHRPRPAWFRRGAGGCRPGAR